MPNRILGGVEGGGTKTVVFLVNIKGEVLADVTGSTSNPWAIGFEECCELINNLVIQALKQAALPTDVPLLSLGLCLSGVETEDIKNQLKTILLKKYSGLSENFYVGSDTRAPLAMVNDKGGVVLISGTGSNCLLINPDETEVSCGGFGDRLGDEGSAYWMAYRSIKICVDNYMKLCSPPNGYSDAKLWEIIKTHFNIETVHDLISVFYSNFNKTEIAALCQLISTLAENGDPLSKWIFKSAGIYLAKHVQAVYNSADESLKSGSGLQVVCVGSVWNSWNLLRPGFEEQLKDTSVSDIRKLSLLTTTRNSAIGAVHLAARLVNLTFPYSLSKNYKLFYEYSK